MKEVVIVGLYGHPSAVFRNAGPSFRRRAGEHGRKALIERTGVDANAIDEVILGQVLTAGAGQNPARQSAIKGGLPTTVPPLPLMTFVVPV